MAALTKPRSTPRLGQDIAPYDFPIAANTKVWLGSIACIDGTNKRMVPGSTATTLTCVGRSRDTYDNTGGAGAAFIACAESGIFRWDNSSAGDLIAQADVGNVCYIVDDHTVAKTDGTGTRSAAGKIIAVDAQGVWVQMKHAS